MEPGTIAQWQPGTIAQWLAILVALGASFYHLYKDYFDVPRLGLSFENERDVKPQQNTKRPNWPGNSQWLRVRVVNTHARKTAKGCRAYLTSIKRVLPDGSTEDKFPNDCRQLGWTHEPSGVPVGKELLPHVGQWFDVAGTFDNPREGMMVCVFPEYALFEAGEYIFTMQVSGEGIEYSPSIKVRIRWDGPGHWNTLRGEYISFSIIQ